jgi:tRNA dimethylallyltransferase
MIRAVEIAMYQAKHPQEERSYPEIRPLLIGIQYDRESRRRRITQRLQQRIGEGLIEEVQHLLDRGITLEQLEYYGLEYKFVAKYLARQLTDAQLFEQLNTAIHQFAKRQTTWFRRMERNGTVVHWLDGYLPMEEKLHRIDWCWGC